ncbi:MAG TPA: hypothetical protein PKD69_04640, partial [Elusimicrobiota bacterium]|nr:hypothetical protein [Elusimicrobiota bacterium]
FMTGGVSHWMTAAAGAAGVAAHALLNVRDSIVRWMGDRTRSVKTLATAALLSLNLLSVPLALSQTNVETPALPLATLERAQVARLNMSQLAPGEASMKRAEQWMAKDNPLLQASAQMQRIKLEGANTPDDLKILTWLLEVTHTWKLDTSKVSAVVLTSNLPAPGMFNDLKKKGESDAEAKRVVYLDRNNTALGLLATWAHEAGHITRDNRQVAEADTLGEDSRIAASLLPYINDAAKDWPGVRDRFGLPADLAFYNPQAMGVLGGTNLSARDAFWLRYDVVPAVAAFLLREAPTPALLSPNHSAVKAEINRLVPLVSQRVFRVQAVYGLSTYSIGITNGRVTITFMDARNRAFPIDLGIPAAPKTPEPGLPAGTGSTQGPNGRRFPGTGEEDFNAWARLALMETLLGSKAEPFEFTIPTPVGSGDYWTARNFNELRSEYTSVDDATRLGGFESFLQLLSNDRTGARRWINEPARREQLAEGALLAAGARAAQDSATTLHVNLFGYKGWSARERKDMRIFLTGLAGAVRPGTNLVVAAEGANPLADVFTEAIKTGAAAVHVLTPARVPGLADAEGRVVMSEVVAWINRPENQKSGMMKGTRIIARDATSVTKAEGFLIIGLQKLSEAIANDIATMLKIMTQA